MGDRACTCVLSPADRLAALIDPAVEQLVELDASGAVVGGYPHAPVCGRTDLTQLVPADAAALLADRAHVVRTHGAPTSIDLPEAGLRARIAGHGAGTMILLRRTEPCAREPSVIGDESFWQLFEAAPVPLAIEIATTPTEEGSSRLNRRFTELFGYTSEDIPTVQHWWPRAYPDPAYREQIREEWFRRLARSAQERTPIEPLEASVTCKDGSTRTIEFYAAAVADRHVVVFVDLTERKRLRAAQEEVLALTELLPLCAWCKKMRDDQGYWQQLEEFVTSRLGARMSHGVCPSCAADMLGRPR